MNLIWYWSNTHVKMGKKYVGSRGGDDIEPTLQVPETPH